MDTVSFLSMNYGLTLIQKDKYVFYISISSTAGSLNNSWILKEIRRNLQKI